MARVKLGGAIYNVVSLPLGVGPRYPQPPFGTPKAFILGCVVHARVHIFCVAIYMFRAWMNIGQIDWTERTRRAALASEVI